MPSYSSGPSPLDAVVENATSDKSQEDDWGQILDICDKIQALKDGPRDGLRAIIKRANHRNHTVVNKSLVLLDACVSNCGRKFHSEISSRDAIQDLRKLANASGKPAEKLRQLIKKWAEGGDLKNESSVVQLNNELKSGSTVYSAVSFSDDTNRNRSSSHKKLTTQELQEKEIEDLARAMALSMQDAQSRQVNPQTPQNTPAGSSANLQSLYPTMMSSQAGISVGNTSVSSTISNSSEPRKVRALYDFEAAEENELTFKTGDVIFVLDDSDANWWRGFTAATPLGSQKEGLLFPSNFVTSDLTYQPAPESAKKQDQQAIVAAAQQPVDQAQVVIDESKIDRGVGLIQAADPTGEQRPDPDELLRIEQECRFMVPLVDAELEKVDSLHAKLTDVNQALVDAFAEYHRIMAQEVVDKRQQMMNTTMPQSYGMPQTQYYDPSQAPGYIPPYGIPIAGAPGSVPYGVQVPGNFSQPQLQTTNGYQGSPAMVNNNLYSQHQPPQPVNLAQINTATMYGGYQPSAGATMPGGMMQIGQHPVVGQNGTIAPPPQQYQMPGQV